MVETRRMERLGGLDLQVLLWDDFGWSGDIGALAILDGARLLDPDGRVRIEAVRRQIEPRLHLVPRFRQRLYRPPWGLGWPLWVDAPSFDLADHVRVHPLAARADQTQLRLACEELARRRLDPARPLWEMWFLPGLPQGHVGLFVKLHHAIADGVAGVAAFGALLDRAADAAAPVAPPWTPAPVPTAGELLHDNLRRRVQGLDRALSSVAHPARTDGSMVVPLPVGEPDHVRRLRLIAAETAQRKNKAHPQMGSGIFRFAVAQRVFLRLFARQRLMNVTVTNVPGPPVPLYLAGAPLLELFPVVSLVANFTLVVAVLSYAGQLNITAVADRDGCPDVEVFALGVRNALDQLARSVLVPSCA